MNFKFRKKHFPIYILFFFGALFFFIGIYNHYLFKTFTYDYGNYNFAFWDYSHFRISPIPTFRGNFLQDHFSFTLMYFVPIYWLLNWLTGTYTLIIIQTSFIMIAAWYSYKIIRLKSNNLGLGIGIMVYFFVLLGRFTAFTSDVNLAIISSCFIPIFIYYFETRKYIVSFVILILSLFSRENIPLWFIFIFIVLIIEHRKERKAVLYALTGIVISITYFIILFKVIIPATESPDNEYALFNYSALGATPGEAFIYIIRNPIESIKLFFVNHLDNPTYDGIKAEFYWVYLLSGGIILLKKPQYLIWFIPIVAQKVLNDAPGRWGIATYYSIEVVTLLPLSVFLVLSSFKSIKVQNVLVAVVCIAAFSMTIHKLDRVNNKAPWLLNTAKSKFYGRSFYEPPFNVKKVNSLLKKIPPKARVSASGIILPHLAQRQKIYYFPVVKDAEYIVFSVYDNNYLIDQTTNENHRNKYLNDPHWTIVDVEFPVFLLKYNDNPSEKNLLNETQTLLTDFEKVNSDEKDEILSEKEKKEHKSYLTNEKALSGEYCIKLTSDQKYSTRIYIKDITNCNYLELSAWYWGNEESSQNMVVDCGALHLRSSESDSTNSSGWKRIKVSFWLPENIDDVYCSLYFINNGKTPAYFDDLQIVKKKIVNDFY